MGRQLIAAAIQMNSGSEMVRNLVRAEELIRRVARRGAELIVLPENFACVAASEEGKLAHAEPVQVGAPIGPIVSRLAAIARELGIWLVLGGMPERSAEAGRAYNTCVLLAPDGTVRAAYRKIHLFDVRTPDGGEYHESRSVAPGGEPLVVETPWGGVGLSVCYDLRFPELYRHLVFQGARFLVVPAAFTLDTGKDHWHVLLRARAIENQCFVIAAAQSGQHNERRVTYGHSLIVDPWGTVLAEAADGEGGTLAELDLERQDRIRALLPALQHRRL